MTHRRAAVLLAATALALTAACSNETTQPAEGAATAAPSGLEVDTSLLTFNPLEAEVKAGQTVTWVAGDNIRHVLVQGEYEVGPDKLRTSETDDKAFDLELTKKGQKVSHTYDKAGTFTYYCTIHKGMNGTVTVT